MVLTACSSNGGSGEPEHTQYIEVDEDAYQPITVDSYGFFFNCTTVGQASDLMTALT